jgi:hypothetical protein
MTSKEIDEILKSPITQGAKGRFISIEQLEQIKNNLKESEQQLKVMTYDGKVYIPVKRQLTFDECVKEWEERGWTVSEKSDFHNGWDYRRYFVSKNEYKLYQPRIVFIKYDKTYYAYEGFDTTDYWGYPKTEIRPLNISEELNDLIRKTLKAMEEMK